MPDSISNSDIDAILRRQFSSEDSSVKCERKDAEEIAAYLEGALSTKRVADLERHLINCADCRSTVIELRALNLDDDESPVIDGAGNKNLIAEPDTVVSDGILGKLKRLIFGAGNAGFAWRPLVAITVLLLLVASPVVLFMNRKRASSSADFQVARNAPAEQQPSSGLVDESGSKPNGYSYNNASGNAAEKPHAAANPQPAAKPEQQDDNRIKTDRPRDAELEATKERTPTASGLPKGSANINYDGIAVNDSNARVTAVDALSIPPALNWTVAVNMTPVDQSRGLVLGNRKDEQANEEQRNSSQNKVSDDAKQESNQRVNNTQQNAQPMNQQSPQGNVQQQSQQTAASPPPPPTSTSVNGPAKKTESKEKSASDAGADRAVAGKAPGSAGGGGRQSSETATVVGGMRASLSKSSPEVSYDKLVSRILKERFDKFLGQSVRSGTGITIRLKISSDGKIVSLENGKVPDADILRRSNNDAINQAAFNAVAGGSLPPFTADVKKYPNVLLTVKFDPVINGRQ
ncbi:MAG TPA: zf-HC2 domain-containing protein [Blastocatellia bacterium]|nr:zf-HC2 domain-containing protein [Blastocatellia bacterium]